MLPDRTDDERLRDIIRKLTPAEVSEVAGNDTNPFMLATAPPLVAFEAEIRRLRSEHKQLADALATEMLKNLR